MSDTDMKVKHWFCPRCGHQLFYPDEFCKKAGDKEKNCNVKCNNKECPTYYDELTIHHPVHGVNADPADSWSISWIK